MNKFVKENLRLLITFSLAVISGNLIYRFYFVPKIIVGEETRWFEISILPIVLSVLWWGMKTDSWQKLLSFSFIISTLMMSYLEMMIWLGINGKFGFDGEENNLFLFCSEIITFTIIISIILGVIRLGFLGIKAFLKEIQLENS